MRAIEFSSGQIRQVDAPTVVPGESEVVVDVIQAGICETDLQLSQGYMGFEGIPGHEFVGVARTGAHAGRRIVGEINCNCQSCPRCQKGQGNHCGNRTVVGIDRHAGAFAEQVAIPEHNLHVVPEHVTNDQAVFVEPLAAAFQITEQITIRPGDNVLILGDGRLALMSAKALSLCRPNLSVIGKHPSKLQRFTCDSNLSDLTTFLLQDIVPSDFHHSQDVVIDCTGSASGLTMALELVRPRGTVMMKTTVAADHKLPLAAIVIHEINLIGSRCGPFDKAIAALADGSVSVDNLITDRFKLDQPTKAFERAVMPDAFKVVFDIE